VPMSIGEAAGQALLQAVASEQYDPAIVGSLAAALSTEEVLASVWSAQTRLLENSILSRYIGGAVSGVSFLMRYSQRGSAPLPLFSDRWEPETPPSHSPAAGLAGPFAHRDLATFNDRIPLSAHAQAPLAPNPPKGSRAGAGAGAGGAAAAAQEMRSRPRILRTPNGSQIPIFEEHGHGMDAPEPEAEAEAEEGQRNDADADGEGEGEGEGGGGGDEEEGEEGEGGEEGDGGDEEGEGEGEDEDEEE
jgi:hypothetical protein